MARMKGLFLVMGFLSLAAAGSVPKVGDSAPQFSLPSAGGNTVSLSDYAGKSKLVLVFYRGYW